MSAFSDGAFSIAAFSETAFDFGTAPAVVVPDTTSGGGFWFGYDHFAGQRRKRKREQEEREAETQQIQDDLDRQVAEQLRIQEAKDAERADLARLQALADSHAGKKTGLPRQVAFALINAQEMRTRSSLEQLRREIERAQEDEELALTISMLLMD